MRFWMTNQMLVSLKKTVLEKLKLTGPQVQLMLSMVLAEEVIMC